MKKYIGVYIFLLTILLSMFITGGIHQGNIVREFEMGDACKTTVILLTYNTIIVVIVLIVGIIFSFIKDNKIRLKWVFPIGMLVFVLVLVPIVKLVTAGGFVGVETEYYFSILKYLNL